MKTVSLELAKALKEAGFSQESDIYWVWSTDEERYVQRIKNAMLYYASKDLGLNIAAPTADEILNLLPMEIVGEDGNIYILVIEKIDTLRWGIKYITDFPERTENKRLNTEWDMDITNAAAKMWLYLKKESLLEL